MKKNEKNLSQLAVFNDFLALNWTCVHELIPPAPQDALTTVNATAQRVWLRKTYQFKYFKDINKFLPGLTAIIVKLNHHPSLTFDPVSKQITLTLTTHAAGDMLSGQDRAFVTAVAKLEATIGALAVS